MAYVVLSGTEDNAIVQAAFATQQEASDYAEGYDGLFSSQVEVVDKVDQGWHFDGQQAVHAGMSVTNLKRTELADKVRALAKLPRLDILKLTEPERVRSYFRWVEMQARALTVDANLEEDNVHTVMKQEADVDGAVFYHTHDFDAWGGYLPSDRDTWSWYSLRGTSMERDSRSGSSKLIVNSRSVVPNIVAPSDFDFAAFLDR